MPSAPLPSVNAEYLKKNLLQFSVAQTQEEKSSYHPPSSLSASPPHPWSTYLINNLNLPPTSLPPLTLLSSLIVSWNLKVNLISRNPPPTPSHVLTRHILPSLSLLKLMPPKPKKIADVGTGGGFPGLPLSLVMPETRFTLIDSTKKN
ncbi:hypothetical protein TL16_g13074 [Triparma laevis f. inornata]|uniref:Uncharacterized protein n=1 Tax=Triparma laevis f. inornata TaxID=1714386 RepID=A0A9W7BWS3_9STRA|nr:hypothetical protein TL16_g13074 [Triparma laevis f. inornata]